MLLDIAKASGRELVTVEHVAEWSPVPAAGHIVTSSLELGLAAFDHFGVALVDGPAAERAVAVLALLPKCDHIVVHDTESVADYPGLADALARCRYRHDFTDLVPWTSVVSDLVPWRP